MSNASAIANFYVDKEGNERPIRYKAVDLVNLQAPEGYIWRKGNTKFDWVDRMWENNPMGFVMHGSQWSKEDHEYDYYYTEKKETP